MAKQVLIAAHREDVLLNVLCGECECNNDSNIQLVPVRGYLEKFFQFTDAQNAPKLLIGMIPAGAMVDRVMIQFFTQFNANLNIGVGDDANPDVLMDFGNDVSEEILRFDNNPDYHYLANTLAYLYFSNALSSQGSGRVVIYFN